MQHKNFVKIFNESKQHINMSTTSNCCVKWKNAVQMKLILTIFKILMAKTEKKFEFLYIDLSIIRFKNLSSFKGKNISYRKMEKNETYKFFLLFPRIKKNIFISFNNICMYYFQYCHIMIQDLFILFVFLFQLPLFLYIQFCYNMFT